MKKITDVSQGKNFVFGIFVMGVKPRNIICHPSSKARLFCKVKAGYTIIYCERKESDRMRSMSWISLKSVKKHLHNNDVEILDSKECVCLACRRSFSARSVSDWFNDKGNNTALCPECGMEAVLGDASGIVLNHEDVLAISNLLFGKGYPKHDSEALYRYIGHYENGDVADSKKSESLYLKYLGYLSDQGDGDAAMALGNFYVEGSSFHRRSYPKAISYLKLPSLSHYAPASDLLGQIYEKLKEDDRAFVAYSKAMSLGSMPGFLHYHECFEKGIFVKQDPLFAMNAFFDAFSTCLSDFVLSCGDNVSILPSLCNKIGNYFSPFSSFLTRKEDNPFSSVFFLLANSCFAILDSRNLLSKREAGEWEECKKTLKDIYGDKKDFKCANPICDDVTFVDSLINPHVLPFVFKGVAKISGIKFDEQTHVLKFMIEYPYRPLVIDTNNGACAFGPKKIFWRFNNVSKVKRGMGDEFNYVYENKGTVIEGLRFINKGAKEKEEEILEISFLPSEDDLSSGGEA